MIAGEALAEKLIQSLKNKKIVLFGAGYMGNRALKWLYNNNLECAYFVDNNRDKTSIEFTDDLGRVCFFAVHAPDILISENKADLKIIITPRGAYEHMKLQLSDMGGLECCLAPPSVLTCHGLDERLIFVRKNPTFLCFCCNPRSFGPEIPINSDSIELIVKNFIQTRIDVIRELNSDNKELNVAKICVDCDQLRFSHPFHISDKIKSIAITDNRPVCQAKCIYCAHTNQHTPSYDADKLSDFFDTLIGIIESMRRQNLLDDSLKIDLVSGEITINPFRDKLYTAAKGYAIGGITNAFEFDSDLAEIQSLNKGSYIQTSLDSGTRETFEIVKGVDAFDKVISNLKLYKERGIYIYVKYIVIPGVNDGDADMDGMVNTLKSIGQNSILLTPETYIPKRTSCYPMVKFIEKLKKRGIHFTTWIPTMDTDLDVFASAYLSDESLYKFEKKGVRLKNAFYNEYSKDYIKFREFVFFVEIEELLECFVSGTRFVLVDEAFYTHKMKINKVVWESLEKLDLSLRKINNTDEQWISNVSEIAAIFIVFSDEQLFNIKKLLQSTTCYDSRCILNIWDYLNSFEPSNSYLERNISKIFLK